MKASYSWQEEVRSQTVNKKNLKSSEADSTKCDWKTSASVFQRERDRGLDLIQWKMKENLLYLKDQNEELKKPGNLLICFFGKFKNCSPQISGRTTEINLGVWMLNRTRPREKEEELNKTTKICRSRRE